jgi:hypothetical protein
MRQMTEAAVRDSAATSTLLKNKYSTLLKKKSFIFLSCMLLFKHWGLVNRFLTEFFSQKDETNRLLDDGFPTCDFCGRTPHFYLLPFYS